MKKNISFIVFILIFTNLIFSQTAEDKLLSKKEKILLVYTNQATQGNRTVKLSVLDKIIEGLDSKEFSSEDNQVTDLVVFLTQEGTKRRNYENNVLINNYPDVRMKACKVLARIKSDLARKALIEVLKIDDSSVVLAEACNALAEIGDNAEGDVLRAIVFLYRSTYQPQQNLVFAVINALKKLAMANSRAYKDVIDILSEIQVGQYNQFIREHAFKAIDELSKQQ